MHGGAAEGLCSRASDVRRCLVEGNALGNDEDVGKRRCKSSDALGVTYNDTDLRNETGGLGYACHDAGVASQSDDAFLDARTGGVIQADDWDTGLECEVVDLGELFCVRLAEGAVEYSGVLAEDANFAAVDGAIAGDDAVGVRTIVLTAEVGRAVAGEGIGLDERTLVEQLLDALASAQVSCGMDCLEGLGAHGGARLAEAVVEILDLASRGFQISHRD